MGKQYIVWELEAAYYQYAWEERECVGRFDTCEEALNACRRTLNESAAVRLALESTQPPDIKRVLCDAPSVWVDGPGVTSKTFDYEAHIKGRLEQWRPPADR